MVPFATFDKINVTFSTTGSLSRLIWHTLVTPLPWQFSGLLYYDKSDALLTKDPFYYNKFRSFYFNKCEVPFTIINL